MEKAWESEKVKAFAKHILKECEEEGFTISEVRALADVYPSELAKHLSKLQDETKFRVIDKIGAR